MSLKIYTNKMLGQDRGKPDEIIFKLTIDVATHRATQSKYWTLNADLNKCFKFPKHYHKNV